jgi:Tol biopolymer transport system component
MTILVALVHAQVFAGPLQPVSQIGPSQTPPAGAASDCISPVISPDGRYVLFASTANNLVVNSNNNPIPLVMLPRMNVYLRDRTNGTTTLVSVNLSGNGGNGDSFPASISTNGQYVLFESSASDLVTNDNNGFKDIFVRDMATALTTLVSVNTNGVSGNGASRNSVMTPDGRYVAFTSDASDLAGGDTNGIPDVFVRDLQGGVTTLASPGAILVPNPPPSWGLPPSLSDWPQVSADGRYVAFYSTASNLVAGAATVGNIYVRDLAAATTTLASSGALSAVQSAFGATNAVCYNHLMCSNGQFIAYEAIPLPLARSQTAGVLLRYNLQTGLTDIVHTNANAAALVYDNPGDLSMTPDGQFLAFIANTNSPSSNNTCVLVWSAQTGATVLASGDLSNSVPSNSINAWPALDSTGRYVTFVSSGVNLTTNPLTGPFHLYQRDLLASVTTLIDLDTNSIGRGVDPEAIPAMSFDGSLVAFNAFGATLVPNDLNHARDVFARNIPGATTELVSAHVPAFYSLTPDGLNSFPTAAISANGRYIAFSSDADNIVPGATNHWSDVFVRDFVLGTNLLVSVGTNGTLGNAASFAPSISGDARYVAFTSGSSNLVAGDTNIYLDVFVRDLQAGTTTLVSVSTNGSSGNGDSYSPLMSGNDRFVVFRSKASNLGPPFLTDGTENLILHDLQAGTNIALTSYGDSCVAITPDGRFIAFDGGISGPSSMMLYIWDTQAMALAYTNRTTGIMNVAVSPDGKFLAYATGTQISMVNRASNTTGLVASATYGFHSSLKVSSNDQWLVYTTGAAVLPQDTNGVSDVYLYDLQAHTNSLVSQSYIHAGFAANGPSDSPDISVDGRFITYRSTASDLVPGAGNGAPQVFLFDRNSGTTTLLSASRFGSQFADNRSLMPAFSADGGTLVFQSWASDLVPQDFNFDSDIFAYALYPFVAQIIAATSPASSPAITWPAAPGKSYSVQYKNNLTDASWQSITGGVTIIGTQGVFSDPAPAATQRFYRIVAF